MPRDQHPPTLDGEGNADGAAIANNPQPRHDPDPLGAPLWKSRQTETMVADTRNEIPGDRRGRTSGYIIVELLQLRLRLWVEDNLVLHPLLGFRLLRAMTRLQPGENRFGRDALR